MQRLMQDMEVSSKAKGTGKYRRTAPKEEPETVSEAEEMDGDSSEDEAKWVDRDDDEVEEEQVNAREEVSLQARYAQAMKNDSSDAALSGGAGEYIRRTQG